MNDVLCWITTILVCMSRVGWNPFWFLDYRDYGSLSTGIWSLRWLFLYLRSYNLIGSVTLLIDDFLRQLPVGLLKWFSQPDIFPIGRLTIYEGSRRMYMPLLIREVVFIFLDKHRFETRPTSETQKTKKNGGLSISTPVLKRNGDFALIFLTLWFYPCDFKTKADFTPAL